MKVIKGIVGLVLVGLPCFLIEFVGETLLKTSELLTTTSESWLEVWDRFINNKWKR